MRPALSGLRYAFAVYGLADRVCVCVFLLLQVDSDEPWAPHPSDPLSVDFTPIPGHVMACYREASSQRMSYFYVLVLGVCGGQ